MGGDLSSEVVGENTVRQIKVVLAALSASLAISVIGVVWVSLHQGQRAPSPADFQVIRLLTIFVMATAVATIAVSEIAWRMVLRSPSATLNTRVLSGFILRTVLREFSGLLGVVVVLRAALNGVLRGMPAYWLNLIPAGLFWSYACIHWPTSQRLSLDLEGSKR